jgi:hypothetical protein
MVSIPSCCPPSMPTSSRALEKAKRYRKEIRVALPPDARGRPTVPMVHVER